MPYVKNTILRQRFDITPWKMKEWREQGIPGIGLRESDLAVVQKLAGGKVVEPRKVEPTDRPSVPYQEAAIRMGIKVSSVVKYKHQGSFSGPPGRIWEDELPGDPLKPSMSYAEAAAEWGVSVVSVRRWKVLGLIEGPHGRVWTNEDRPETGRSPKRSNSPSAPIAEVSTRGISGYRSVHRGSPDFRPYHD